MKYLFALVLATAVGVFQPWSAAVEAQTKAAPPARAQVTTPTVPRLPAAAIERLLLVGAESSGFDFLGIHKIEDGSSMLSISSARQNIAYAAANAAGKGGRYNPPPAMRADIVFVTCGDEDLGDRWDCARISVLNSAGRRVAPLTYSAGPETYRNALGSSWSATKATATYRLSDLSNGFSVHYSGTDGTEFTEVVPRARVESELLSVLPLTKEMRVAAEEAAAAAAKAATAAAIAAEPAPPETFDVVATQAPEGWTVTSRNAGYTWRDCRLLVGGNSAAFKDLAPDVPVLIPFSAFHTPVSTGVGGPVVRCVAKGRSIEGPVPAELAISVASVGPGSWSVRNLTDWAWPNCEATVGTSKAKLSYLLANAAAVLTAKDFTPPLGPVTDPSAFELTCEPNGRKRGAVRK